MSKAVILFRLMNHRCSIRQSVDKSNLSFQNNLSSILKKSVYQVIQSRCAVKLALLLTQSYLKALEVNLLTSCVKSIEGKKEAI